MAEVVINEQEFKNLLEENKTSIVGLAKIVAQAKGSLSKKDYSTFIAESELSKDQISRLLKRAQLLSLGFSDDTIGIMSDSKVLKLTNKQVDNVEELQLARKELAKGEIEYNDFVELFDSYKVRKSDNEKFSTKVDGVVKALEKMKLTDDCLTDNANKLAEFVKEWGCEELA